jgi:hypothetical protein
VSAITKSDATYPFLRSPAWSPDGNRLVLNCDSARAPGGGDFLLGIFQGRSAAYHNQHSRGPDAPALGIVGKRCSFALQVVPDAPQPPSCRHHANCVCMLRGSHDADNPNLHRNGNAGSEFVQISSESAVLVGISKACNRVSWPETEMWEAANSRHCNWILNDSEIGCYVLW